MKNQLHVLILAAGKGTRMHSAKPKVLHELAGLPLIEHVYNTSKALKPTGISIIHGHGSDQLKHWEANASVEGLNWIEQKEQLGTAHAVKEALPSLSQLGLDDSAQILLLAGDVPLIRTETLKEFIKISPDSFGLMTVSLDDPSGYGRILRNEAGQVSGVVEQKDATEQQKTIQEVNTNIMLVTFGDLKQYLPQINNNNAQGEYYLPDLIELVVNDGKVVSIVQPQHVWEVEGTNNQCQLHDLERRFQQYRAFEFMSQGLKLQDASRFDLHGELEFGQDVSIGANVEIKGQVVLGDKVVIESNVILENVKIGSNSRIRAFSHVSGAEIGENCQLGPYARVREGSVFENQSKIGNFVETKNVILGRGSKAGHLTYLGDAVISDGVNIGAGTICCNYDGVNKHKTIIGKGAFIGSNASLVAPVSIGENATIGAGSVVSKTAPPDSLTLTRAKQLTLSNWRRPVKK